MSPVGGVLGPYDPASVGPLGTLGYAQITANQTSITTLTDVTGLASTVTVGSGRRIRISFYCHALGSNVVTDAVTMSIMEGATQLQDGNFEIVTGFGTAASMSVVLTPSAGSHTYKIQAVRQGSGSVTVFAGSADPAYILVEDIGT